jgi:hypothetical protein
LYYSRRSKAEKMQQQHQAHMEKEGIDDERKEKRKASDSVENEETSNTDDGFKVKSSNQPTKPVLSPLLCCVAL